MNLQLQAVVAVDDEVDRGLIETVVSASPQVTVLDYLEIGAATASAYGVGDVLIVACADYRPGVRDYLLEARRQHPSRPIVLMCPTDLNGHVAEAFELGVDDIVNLPSDEDPTVDAALVRELPFTLQKALIRRRGAPQSGKRGNGRQICVLGLKGGCGKTLITANLGVALARSGHTVAMIDLDLQFGDLGLALGVTPSRTVYDLVRAGGSLDADKLEDYLVEHPSGARTLLAPLNPEQSGQISLPFLREVERLLRESHDYVLIDTPPSFTPEVISATDASSDVLMVAMRDTLSLKNTKLGLETLQRMDYDPSRIRLVLNRANTSVGLEQQDLVNIVGRDFDVLIPSHRDITRSIVAGEPIVQNQGSSARKAFLALAELYAASPRVDKPADGDAGPGWHNGNRPGRRARPRRSIFRRG